MSNDDGDRGIARRKVLAAAAGAGGLGLAGGLGSAALLRDEESLDGLFESGSLALDVTWDNTDGESLTAALETGDTNGQGLLEVSLPGSANNPAHVWFQPTCPPESAAGLADALELSIYHSNEDGEKKSQSPVANGTLRDLAEQPGTKLRFDGDECLDADTTRYLLVEWGYTEDSAEFDEAGVDLRFFAEQCRNNDGPANPYESLSCPVPPCPCCQLVGKLELEDSDDESGDKDEELDKDGDGIDDSYVGPGQYAFTEGDGDYELVVSTPETKGSGPDTETVAVSVDVVGVDGTPDPELCEVVLKAGGGPPGSDDRVSYAGDDLEGDDAATPPLYSVPRTEPPTGSEDYYGISSITVGICVGEEDGSCPGDVVSPTGNAGDES